MDTQLRSALVVAVVIIAVAFSYRGLTYVGSGQWAEAVPVPFERIPEFALGMAIAWAFAQGSRPRIPVRIAWGLFAEVMGGLTVVPRQQIPVLSDIAGLFINEFATLACVLLIISIVNTSLGGRRSWLVHPWMVRLGNRSCTLYLLHATVIYAVLNIMGESKGPLMSNLVWGTGVTAKAFALHGWRVTVLTATRDTLGRLTGSDPESEKFINPRVRIVRIPFVPERDETDLRN